MAEDWFTYAEAARLLGKTPEAVRAIARRQHWPRQTPNLPGGHARVQIPEMTGLDRPCPPLTDGQPPLTDGQMTGPDRVSDDVVRVFDRALAALQQQLEHERERADRAEHRIDELHQRIDELHTALADAVTAERIAAGEAAALRAIVDGLRARPWWRRWRK